jgi:hypothetical protein
MPNSVANLSRMWGIVAGVQYHADPLAKLQLWRMSGYRHLIFGQRRGCPLQVKLRPLGSYLGHNLVDVLVPDTDISGRAKQPSDESTNTIRMPALRNEVCELLLVLLTAEEVS